MLTLTLYQANAPTLMPLSKEDKILIKSLQECKGYNTRQLSTKYLDKGWTKKSINRLLVKFGTVDRRPGSGRRSACTDNIDTVESLLLSQEDKPQSQRTVGEISHEERIHRSSVSRIIHKDLRLKCCKKMRAAQQLTEAHSMHALFSVCSLRYDNKQTYMKTETCKPYSVYFWSLLNISAKYHQNRSIYFRAIPFQSWVVFWDTVYENSHNINVRQAYTSNDILSVIY